MSRKLRRFLMVAGGLLCVGGAVALVLGALRQNVVYFFGPTELLADPPEQARRVRLGGLVEAHSVTRGADNAVQFAVTDGRTRISVHYVGLLPDLFREGQGVVAEGRLSPDGAFMAETVLAKHDERYMPPEVAAALKKQGVWRDDKGPAP